MDAHDVKAEYWEMIKSQKQTLKEAKKRQGQRPQDRKPREYAYMRFMMARQPMMRENTERLIHSSFTAPAYPPCITTVDELKQIKIQDLQLETHHRGVYLLLRCITPPSRMTAIMVLVEDKNEDVAMLQIYQQEDEEIRPAAEIANTGTVLLVKEPYYKVMGDGEYGLRVDHLSDVVQLKGNNARIPSEWQSRVIEVGQSVESLKQKGNLAMKEGRFWEAITIYSDALEQAAACEEADDVLKRNRSLAFLRTKQFDAALSDTGFPNFDDNSSEKAMFRAGEALYHLRRYDDCCQILEKLCRLFPLNTLAQAASGRAQSRLREQKTGEYNFKLLQAEAKKIRPPHLDHATYIGPVEVKQTASKGRGLFVTKAVKAGDLLLCEKAFAHCYASNKSDGENAGGSNISILINAEADTIVMGTQAELLKTMIQKIYHNPSLAPALTTLYHGDYQGLDTLLVDEMPIVDTFLVERIMSLNSFGCPLSSLNHHKDVGKIKNPPGSAFHSCGTWIQASYINHSCTSNVRRSFIGDMMIVRAICDLEESTELFFWYHCPEKGNSNDTKNKLKYWGFECECSICSDDKATPLSTQRQREVLRKSLEKTFRETALGNGKVQKIERLLDELNQTYSQPADKVPRLLVWDMQLLLAHGYASRNKTRQVIVAAGKVLISLGFIITGVDSSEAPLAISRWGMLVDHLVEIFMLLRNAFVLANNTMNSDRAGEYAKTAYKMVVGEDVSFDIVWGANAL